ncbi:putative enzyme related to lactoylglutathione lyase [Conyzicola lurida]|uniref:Putative enzyme related to lactoylglutathione lyase n=1 Tax=Conyzicola lurida TaxID=1172621 RepID=A0A841AN27_9MICO|nr:VOC family protein [Conyzicola lurida]MBB5843352.1 putative enzyme related to lactoylglutathione lyase [Conyzicola lurida]
MPEQRTYPTGVTCWIAAEEPDPEAASRFYGRLFGWSFHNVMPPDAPVYLMASLDGADVGAISAGTGAPRWTTFVATDDVDATTTAIGRAGGTVVAPPRDAGTDGRTATALDPQGAEFRLWQAQDHPGAQLVNVPGTWNFSDLLSSDPEAARRFYTGVFGWRYLDFGATVEAMIAVPGYGDYLAATSDPHIYERQAGAPEGFADVIGAVEPAPAGTASRWRVKFSVADRASSIALVEDLGGTVLATDDQVWALLADIRDPQGAEFTISEFRDPR